MTMVAGRLMQRELDSLNRVLNKPDRPCIFVLGGAKVEDRIPVIRRVLSDRIADRILVGGLIHKVFHIAKGYFPNSLGKLTEEEQICVAEATEILEKFGDIIELPIDMALGVKSERIEVQSDRLTDETNIYDVGLNTIARYCDQIKRAGTVVAEGPLGMFERRGFDVGTKELLRAMAECSGFTVVGGGHLGGMASMMDVLDRMSHVSTGGGAMLTLLAGEQMPVITALEKAKKRYG
jgi:phosphoglycerate kinase